MGDAEFHHKCLYNDLVVDSEFSHSSGSNSALEFMIEMLFSVAPSTPNVVSYPYFFSLRGPDALGRKCNAGDAGQDLSEEESPNMVF